MDPYYYRWKKIQSGDLKTFEKLYKKLFPELQSYAFRILRDEFLSEEVVQDVFLKIWQKRGAIKIKGSVSGYLYSITHNLAINAAIQKKTYKNKVNQIVSEEIWQQIHNTFAVMDNVSKKIEKEETELKIKALIETLPKQCKTVFLLSRFENMTNQEIAQKLDISIHTVRAHLYHALKIISKIFEK
jgi:RNA polymerase sigma-70 factor (ECF subfamily)